MYSNPGKLYLFPLIPSKSARLFLFSFFHFIYEYQANSHDRIPAAKMSSRSRTRTISSAGKLGPRNDASKSFRQHIRVCFVYTTDFCCASRKFIPSSNVQRTVLSFGCSRRRTSSQPVTCCIPLPTTSFLPVQWLKYKLLRNTSTSRDSTVSCLLLVPSIQLALINYNKRVSDWGCDTLTSTALEPFSYSESSEVPTGGVC